MCRERSWEGRRTDAGSWPNVRGRKGVLKQRGFRVSSEGSKQGLTVVAALGGGQRELGGPAGLRSAQGDAEPGALGGS